MSQEHLPAPAPLASALQGVKLRSAPRSSHSDELAGAATLTAPSALAAALQMERGHNARLRAVDLESWYDSISDKTFKTIFLPLAPDEARCITQEYHRKIERAASSSTQHISSHVHHADDDACLLQLQARISDALASLGGHAFVKLSSRSPKDSRTCEQRAFESACDIIRGAKRKYGVVDLNFVHTTLISSGIAALRCCCASDVVETLTTSERVCTDDIPLALSFPTAWSQHVVLRQWRIIPPHHEFRVFIYQGKITGASQYFCKCFFPELQGRASLVCRLINELFVSIKDRLTVQPAEYALDVAVDIENEVALVIELNPFGKPDGLGTGTCLFDRCSAADMRRLFDEDGGEFELRMETEVPADRIMHTLLRDGPLKAFLEGRGRVALRGVLGRMRAITTADPTRK